MGNCLKFKLEEDFEFEILNICERPWTGMWNVRLNMYNYTVYGEDPQ